MNNIEHALKNLGEGKVPEDPEFRRKLRTELLATRANRQVSARWFPLTAAALAACLILLALFVLRPGLPQHLHHLALGQPEPQPTPDLSTPPTWLQQASGSAQPVQLSPDVAPMIQDIRTVESEQVYILRHVILENGERAVLFSEVDAPDPKPYKMY